MIALPLRVLRVVVTNFFCPRLENLSSGTVETFRVTPFDLDVFQHMNNARYLSYMEVARWGFQLRTGFMGLALRKRWIAPLSKVDIRFLRPLKLFQKFTVSVKLVRVEERFVYLYQEFHSHGKVVARALVCSALRSKEGVVQPSQYMEPLGYSLETVQAPLELQAWLNQL